MSSGVQDGERYWDSGVTSLRVLACCRGGDELGSGSVFRSSESTNLSPGYRLKVDGCSQGQQVDGGLQVSDLQVLGVQQPEQGAAHTVDLVRHAGKSLSSQTHRLLNRLRCVLSLEEVALAVICDAVEVTVVINQIPPGSRRFLKYLGNNFRKPLLLRHFSHRRC